MSHYETLGVTGDATAADIKKAWRRKSSAAHPDKAGGSHEAMSKINLAYEVLIDEERRKHYDETGENEVTPPFDVAARAQLLQNFMMIVDDAPDNCDLVFETDRFMQQKQAKIALDKIDLKKQIGKLTRRANRILMRAGGKDNFLVGAINARIELTKPALEALEQEMDLLERAREMLRDYRDSILDGSFMQPEGKPQMIDQGKVIGSLAYKWPEGS